MSAAHSVGSAYLASGLGLSVEATAPAHPHAQKVEMPPRSRDIMESAFPRGALSALAGRLVGEGRGTEGTYQRGPCRGLPLLHTPHYSFSKPTTCSASGDIPPVHKALGVQNADVRSLREIRNIVSMKTTKEAIP